MILEDLQPGSDIVTKSGRVAVLMGGTSAEREVSLKSGGFVLQALQEAGVDAFAVDIRENPLEQIQMLEADHVFNILHGRGGEDGVIQALLEVKGLPYVGSGIKASAVTMDKLMTKRLLKGAGIQTPSFIEMKNEQEASSVIDLIGLPLIIKPVNEGSSIGMSKVERAEDLVPAYQNASQFGDVMAERWIDGEEYTVAWVGGVVLPAIKLETPHQFYDYAAKYQANDTRYLCPCGLDEQKEQQLQNLVAQTVDICDLRHWGRVDIMMDHHGYFQIIEVNTVPGMTDHSLVPMAANAVGLDFKQLVLKLVELSLNQEVPA